jgi:Phosphotyrosyl phosphate activator (PTPA) protein
VVRRQLKRFCLMQGVKAVLRVLDSIEQTAKSIPPVDNSSSRFGNPAFRTFYDKVSEVYTTSPLYIIHGIYLQS